MKFLKKLLNRSSEEDDDDFEDSDFGFDDEDDGPTTEVLMDDDELDGNLGPDSMDDDLPESADDDFDDSADDPIDLDEVDTSRDEDRGDADPEFGGDDGDIDFGDDDDDIDFGDDDDDIDFGDDDDDYDDDDDEDDGKRRQLIFIAAGVGVLLFGMAGGGAFWYFSGDSPEETVAEAPPQGAVQMSLPPRAGSLNAGGTGAAPRAGGLNAFSQSTSGETPVAEPDAPADSAAQQEESPAPAGDGDGEQDAAAASAASAEQGAPAVEEQAGPQTLNQAAAAGLGSGSLNSLAGAGGGPGQGLVIPSVTRASFQAIPDQPKPVPLASAPDRRLLEKVEGLERPLPSVAQNGRRKPWEVYARPLTGNEKGQRVGILVSGLGLSRAATLAAISKLPGEVSLVFDPYARDLDDWLLRARLAGHEVFVGLPMESEDFPAEDPGPLGLVTTVQSEENMKRLHGVLSSFSGYVGVVSIMGSKFSTAEGQLKPILTELKNRGLMFVDGGAIRRSVAPRIAAEIDLPRAISDMKLDDPPSPGHINRQLNQLEKLIQENSTAIGMARAYPTSIQKIADWAKTLASKQLALVPVSAIANKQFVE